MKRLLSLVLAVLLLAGLTACGTTTEQTAPAQTDDSAQTAAEAAPVSLSDVTPEQYGIYTMPGDYHGELPLVQPGEEKTITIGIRTSGNCTDYKDNEYTRWLEEQTGLNLEFVQFAGSTNENGTQISLMIAAGERLPDIILEFPGVSKAQAREYCADGYFIDLGPYLTTQAYYMRKTLETYYPEDVYAERVQTILAGARDPKTGNIAGFPDLTQHPTEGLMAQMWINRPWLDKLGLEKPTTMAELRTVLEAFRDGDPNGNGKKDEIPMVGRYMAEWKTDIVECVINAFIYCFDTNKFNVNDGVVTTPYMTDEYRQALQYISDLVKDGLLDRMTWSIEGSELTALINPSDGVYTVGISAFPGESTFETDGGAMDVYEPLAPFKDETGKGGYGVRTGDVSNIRTYITEDCEDPELAFRLLDFMCTPESYLRQSWGVRGEDWDYCTEENAVGVYGGKARIEVYDRAVSHEANNRMWHGAIFSLCSNTYWQEKLEDDMSKWDVRLYKKLQEQIRMFDEAGMPEQVIRVLNRTPEEDEAFQDHNSDLMAIRNTARTNFCTGIWDPYDDAQWDDYCRDMTGLGYQRGWIDVAQAHFDRLQEKLAS